MKITEMEEKKHVCLHTWGLASVLLTKLHNHRTTSQTHSAKEYYDSSYIDFYIYF